MAILKPRLIIFLFQALGVSVLIGTGWMLWQLRDLGRLTVRFFDVGQGDAILVTTPAGRQILVDGGPDNTLVHKLGRTLPVWDRTIDLVVLTHPHADHLVGLVELLRRYRVSQVLVADYPYDTPEANTWRSELAGHVRAPTIAVGPVRQVLEPGLELTLLHPTKDFQPSGNPNDASIVLRVGYGATSLLLSGDLESAAQGTLPPALLSSDVLKVAHHGSADALNLTLLEAANPQLAVISVGKNTYGHPSRRVVKALERLPAQVLTTQAAGDITLHSNGRQWRLSRSRQGPARVITP